jgi:hypothetical protein
LLSYTCECGHAEDEHDPITRDCKVEGCPCFYYEDTEDEEDEDD